MFRMVLSGFGFLMLLMGPASALEPGLDSKMQPQQLASFEQGIIEKVMMEVESDIEDCYQYSLQSNPNLSGSMQLRVMVYQDGSVVDVAAEESTLRSPHTESCIENERFTQALCKKQ